MKQAIITAAVVLASFASVTLSSCYSRCWDCHTDTYGYANGMQISNSTINTQLCHKNIKDIKDYEASHSSSQSYSNGSSVVQVTQCEEK